jgi:putative deoxynucleotide monophosphate kinase
MSKKELDYPVIIALSGKKGSGKDTVANMLEYCFNKYHHQRLHKVAFADPVREIASIVASTAQVHFIDRYWKEQPVSSSDERSPREYLRLVGQSLKSTLGPDVWIRVMDSRVFTFNAKNCVITDVRFRNELDYVKGKGAFLIKIERDGCEGDDDVSETEMDSFKDEEFDLIIKNNGTREELSETISNFVKNLKIK